MSGTPSYRAKRAFDIVIALAAALPALVIVVFCCLLVMLEDRANPLFVQTRVGRGQKPFRLVKLRTMAVNVGDLPSHEMGDRVILSTGRVLRKVKFDELPQIWNVLNGSMSFVGPRPCLPIQHELIEEREVRGVFDLRPGITGPAQIAGIDMSTPRELAEADAAYIGRNSALSDLGILFKTFLGGGSGDAAGR